MARAKILGLCFGVGLAILSQRHGTPINRGEAEAQRLTVNEASDRILLAWSGPIAEPMRDQLASTLDRYRDDPRRIVVSINSPGGSVAHGRLVAAAIRDAGRTREIDTLVAQGGACASMCLPIYLSGRKRMAAAGAHFMFHEVKLDEAALTKAGLDAAAGATLRRVLEQSATDDLFETDLSAERVDAQWLAALRARISGRDVWISGRELVDQGSGVVDVLVPGQADAPRSAS